MAYRRKKVQNENLPHDSNIFNLFTSRRRCDAMRCDAMRRGASRREAGDPGERKNS